MSENQLPELKTPKSDEFLVSPDKVIIIPGRNIRPINEMWVKTLKELIRQNGQAVAIVGKRGKEEGTFEVASDGHHRTLAIKELWEEGLQIRIRLKLEPKGTSELQRTYNQLMGDAKLQLSPMAIAEGINRAFMYGATDKEIATKLNKSTTYVNQYNSLNAQSRLFKSLVEMGTVTPTLAFEIIEKGEDYTNQFLKDYQDGKFDKKPDAQLTIQPQNTEKEPENEPALKKPTRITAKSLSGGVNSFKSFQKWAKAPTTFSDRIPQEKKPVYDFLIKVINNELTELEIIKYFNND